MRTFELLIVLGALMALIALVAIGIDWIGKPMRGRRFVPRMYRYDDEKVPFLPVAPPPGPPYGVVLPPHQPAGAVPPAQPMPLPTSAPAVTGTSSAFQNLAASPDTARPVAMHGGTALTGHGWQPGMALDAQFGDRRPNLATKAQRYWQSIAVTATAEQFDADERDRMSQGRPPRRTNRRSGRTESMQLSGLREASDPSQVRMHWPDDSVDPWSTG